MRKWIGLGIIGIVATGALAAEQPASKPAAETVMVTYHVTAGKEAELERVIGEAWKVYQSEKMLADGPHMMVKGTEGEGKPRVVEIFSWVNADAPDHASDAVKKCWEKMMACCEKREGHEGLEIAWWWRALGIGATGEEVNDLGVANYRRFQFFPLVRRHAGHADGFESSSE